MSNSFLPGDKVIVDMPLSPDDGKIVTIVKGFGPVIMSIFGMPCRFKESYQVEVPGYGSVDKITRRPIVYPPEFLKYAVPELEVYTKTIKSSWSNYDTMIEELNETSNSAVIKQGTVQ